MLIGYTKPLSPRTKNKAKDIEAVEKKPLLLYSASIIRITRLL